MPHATPQVTYAYTQIRGSGCTCSKPRPGGTTCDEYPFASASEGTSTGGGAARTSSQATSRALPTRVTGPCHGACMIDTTQDSPAGSLLDSTRYVPLRVVEGDPSTSTPVAWLSVHLAERST